MTSQRRKGFWVGEEGSMSLLAMYVLGGALMVSAFAIDFAYLMSAKTQLQVAADAAAHAALYYREDHDAESAKAKAVDLAQHDMPSAKYGMVLTAADVEFGQWDYASQTFTVDPNSKYAVRVRPSRVEDKGNPVSVFLFRLMNESRWDVAAEAVFVTFYPHCLREGFVAEDIVDLQSNNGYQDGFCIHSNTNVSINSNNTFEPGTIVSMPDSSNIDLPRSGFKTNEGLQAALRNGYYRLRMLSKLGDVKTDLDNGFGTYVPDYVSGLAPVVISKTNIDGSYFTPGRIHTASCGNKKLNIAAGSVLTDVVLVTDCQIKFGNGVRLENALIYTTNTNAKSIYAASSLYVGRDDNCAPDGGAQVITLGGFDVASDLRMNGGQVIAQGDIQFAANANGIQGASMLAGGTISGTSNMEMGFCDQGMEDNLEAPYFRLAR